VPAVVVRLDNDFEGVGGHLGNSSASSAAVNILIPCSWQHTSSKPVTALDRERHGVKIAPVGVEVFEVEEQAFVVDEMRPRVPSRHVQLDQAISRHAEGGDVFDAWARVVAEIARWRHTDEPFFVAERAQALGDPPVARDPGEAEPDMRQMHDPQPRLAIAQDELCRVAE
jgi:hypothetical protein